jgi:cystathionine beta-lyase
MKEDTKLAHAGRDPHAHHGAVNTPVYHASTILFPTMEKFVGRSDPSIRIRYGLRGTPTSFALEDALTALEHGHGTVLAPSGLQAITVALLAFLKAGDHMLVTDSTYAPTRNFANRVLTDLGIETEYYDPTIGGDIAALIRPNTRIVWTESPGSQTFEMQDIPAIAEAAHKAGAVVMIDNTWAAGYYYKPLNHGADISIHAITKYVGGHSDLMMGAMICNEATYDQLKTKAGLFGNFAAPDDVNLAMRGFRTLGVRLPRHFESGLKVANWLQSRPEVARVMHPALPDDPGHALWKRHFTGASGLFGFIVKTDDRARVAAMLDGLELFGMGASWGGFESLLIPTWPQSNRSVTAWEAEGQTLRIHIGLEDPDDLIADLEAGFKRLNGG